MFAERAGETARHDERRIGGTPFVSLQPPYSLTSRKIEEGVLPTCQRHGLGTMIYSPLGGGVLTGKYKKDEAPPTDSRAARGAFWGNVLNDQNLATAAEVAVENSCGDSIDSRPAAVGRDPWSVSDVPAPDTRHVIMTSRPRRFPSRLTFRHRSSPVVLVAPSTAGARRGMRAAVTAYRAATALKSELDRQESKA